MSRIEIKLDKLSKSELVNFVRKWERIAIEVTKAGILILANNGKHNDKIAYIREVDRNTILKGKKRYIPSGVDKTIDSDRRAGQPIKYSDSVIAKVIALAYSAVSEGRKR